MKTRCLSAFIRVHRRPINVFCTAPRGRGSERMSQPCQPPSTVTSEHMIYTCYEMVRDCRANLPEGWTHFISYYVPVIRKALAHYAPERAGDAALLDHILVTVQQSESF